MPDSNPFTRAADRLATRLADAAKDAEKSKATPFGFEQVTPETEARAFAAMNREGKAKFLEQHATEKDPKGLEYAMRVLRREQKV